MKKAGLIISFFVLSIISTYAQMTLTENDLVKQYGAIRKDMVLKACEYCNYTDEDCKKKITENSLTNFIKSLDSLSDIYKTICNFPPLSSTEIDLYHKNLIKADSLFCVNLKWVVHDRHNASSIQANIQRDYEDFRSRITSLTNECEEFNRDDASYKNMYPNGCFIYKFQSADQLHGEESVMPEAADGSGSRGGVGVPGNEDSEPDNQHAKVSSKSRGLVLVIWALSIAYLLSVGCLLYFLYKSRQAYKDLSSKRKDGEETENNTPSINTEMVHGAETKYEKFAVENNDWIIVGASVIGKGHIESNMPCQDSHIYTDLGNGWGLAVVSDGAGSAKYSHIGSKAVVSMTKKHFEQSVKASSWYNSNVLPDDLIWYRTAYKELKAVSDAIQEVAEKHQCKKGDFAATVIVVVHAPMGLLAAHIGDGRAGYQDKSGTWHSLMQPHKGDEANQTIFVTSDFWNIPNYAMSGVSVPETRVVREDVKSFVLMSDGCEFASWNCNLYNADEEKFYDPNTPYAAFFNPLTETLREHKKNNLPFDKRCEKWYDYLNNGNKPFIKENDDKTMILGTISKE